MASTIVKLTTPLHGHQVVTELEFREPTFDDFMELGEPYIWIPQDNGVFLRSTIFETVKRYAERLFVQAGKPGNALLLGEIGNLEDAQKVRRAVEDFFLKGDPMIRRSPISEPTSSSSSDGAPALSAG